MVEVGVRSCREVYAFVCVCMLCVYVVCVLCMVSVFSLPHVLAAVIASYVACLCVNVCMYATIVQV